MISHKFLLKKRAGFVIIVKGKFYPKGDNYDKTTVIICAGIDYAYQPAAGSHLRQQPYA